MKHNKDTSAGLHDVACCWCASPVPAVVAVHMMTPGPALPLLGHLHLMDKDPWAKFRVWQRQYGDVFSLYMGGRVVVVLNDFPVIREALVTFTDVLSDRPHMFLTDKFSHNNGMSLTSF